MKRSCLLLIAVLAAGGCSLGGKAPRQLLSLSAASTLPAGGPRTATAENSLTVLVPGAVSAVAGNRVPVYDGGTAIAYVADARWIDTPARQLQALLSETIAARTDRVVLDPRQTTADTGTRIGGTLQQFGIEAATNQAVVTFDAQRSRPDGRIDVRRFQARAPVAAIDALNAASALNTAANAVATEVAAWVG